MTLFKGELVCILQYDHIITWCKSSQSLFDAY